jgi:tryptophan halogenase
MHICIIGTGVSGLMSACELVKLDFVKKITIIGSKRIPSIKVGESTTYPFYDFVKRNFDVSDFVQKSDATVKYGVYYSNWSKKDFIHFFTTDEPFLRNSHIERSYCELLANKDPDIHIHDLIGNKLWKTIQKNEVSLDFDEQPHSWHFDAGKIKIFLKNHLKNNTKVTFFEDTIINCKFSFDDIIEYVIGENNTKYIADYFVNCCGSNEINEKIFKEEYFSLSSYLLTDKALVYPLKYKDKRKEFNPYTIAKTMKNGWRWITPTQSRIGTGYVFSSNHVSIDEATNEFINDIGDRSIDPFLVDFIPRYNVKPFKLNSCTIGLSSGFLEPLDAPGLAFTSGFIDTLVNFLSNMSKMKYKNMHGKKEHCKSANSHHSRYFEWWCSFILHQYKTCWRRDTPFWLDHKSVKCDFYEHIISSMEYVPMHLFEKYEYEMFFKTTAAKDIQWKSKIKLKPFPVEQLYTETIHHLDYIQKFYE